jgi:hypothetical protein
LARLLSFLKKAIGLTILFKLILRYSGGFIDFEKRKQMKKKFLNLKNIVPMIKYIREM